MLQPLTAGHGTSLQAPNAWTYGCYWRCCGQGQACSLGWPRRECRV